FTGPGKQVFMSKGCVACHNFGGGDSATGPDLKGVTERRTADWIKKWIDDPAAMLKSDPQAQELSKKYTTHMPKFGLTAEEIDQVIEYFKWQDQQGATAQAF